MPPSYALDRRTRQRIATWVELKMRELGWTKKDVCDRTGVQPSSMTRLFNDGMIGLDVFVKLSRGLLLNADNMINRDPPGFRPDGSGQRS